MTPVAQISLRTGCVRKIRKGGRGVMISGGGWRTRQG